MLRKPYCATLAEFGRPAELAGNQLMREKGFSITHLPNGAKGEDILCESERERFYLDVERRTTATWGRGHFPYRDVNVLTRRPVIPDRIFIVFREDLQRCLVIFYGSLKIATIENRPNRLMDSEEFRIVPLAECLEFDVKDNGGTRSFAEMNKARIYKIMREGISALKTSALGNVCPYGMDSEEWREMLRETTKETERKITGKPPIHQKTLFGMNGYS